MVKSFRAIIVGGGPAGLGLGHALTLAGIDYVILERQREVAEPGSGASIALWPHSARVLDQFGLLEEAQQLARIIKNKRNHGPDGKEISRSNMFEVVEINHGYPWMLFHRPEFLELLYRRLPDKETRVKTNKKVIDFETLPDGVRVHCEDGEVEEGSIVIGCDGVHSRIRQIMTDLARKAGTKLPSPQKEMVATYQALIGYLPRRPEGLEPVTVYEVRNTGTSFHVLTGTDDAYFFVYNKLCKPTSERRRYTATDILKVVNKVRKLPITPQYTFQDLWAAQTWHILTDLQEGHAQCWAWDRVVCVGDAVHKVTPNAGLGLNIGWQGACELTNRLRALLEADPNPDTAALTDVFRAYQQDREPLARQNGFFSALYTRVCAWHNVLLRAADFMAPWLGGDVMLLNVLASPIVAKGITLDFVEEPHHRTGRFPWANKPMVAGRVSEDLVTVKKAFQTQSDATQIATVDLGD